MTTNQEVQELYEELAAMTKPLCAQCDPPFACCKVDYCNFAKVWAKQRYDIELTPTNAYPHAPFLGPEATGCQLAPYLRPMCSAWACEPTLAKQSSEFKARYFQLRNRLRRIEFSKLLGLPEEAIADTLNEDGDADSV